MKAANLKDFPVAEVKDCSTLSVCNKVSEEGPPDKATRTLSSGLSIEKSFIVCKTKYTGIVIFW